MIDLKGKRILFFHLPNYGYHKVMIDAFEKAGASVDAFDSRPSHSFWAKALIRINRNLIGVYINKYYNKILGKISNNTYDYVYFYKGEAVSEDTIKQLRALNPYAHFVLYFCDSIENNHCAQRIIQYFDKCYTFDKYDSLTYNISFLPLFYSPYYANIASSKVEKKYDFLFVGTVHSDRYNFVSKIVSQFREMGKKAFTYYYFPNKILYYKMCFQNAMVRKAPKDEFHFLTIPPDEMTRLMQESKIVVDIQHPKQTGLTMRTIETLGAKRKLITTNKEVVNYDFYDPQNILVVDRQNPVISELFINTPYKEIPFDIYNKYSINSWITQLLS